MEKNKIKDLSNIAVSLAYGAFEGSNRKKLIIAYVMLVIIFCSAIILGVILLSIEYINNPNSSLPVFIGGILSIIIGFSLVICVFSVLVHRNEEIRKQILLWIEDAIELNAYSRNIGTEKNLLSTLVKLQVEFKYDGIRYVRTSENEHRSLISLGRPVGYFAGVSMFADKNVKILYSPKYDQVMILKNE